MDLRAPILPWQPLVGSFEMPRLLRPYMGFACIFLCVFIAERWCRSGSTTETSYKRSFALGTTARSPFPELHFCNTAWIVEPDLGHINVAPGRLTLLDTWIPVLFCRTFANFFWESQVRNMPISHYSLLWNRCINNNVIAQFLHAYSFFN
ncbi:hypothetical protein BC830DRAFT_677735 [Chytriomyces sp. MP71]|nr:hypothetical protein BC830DRAFT_677735 [Chytriomyces sp. MP71]